MGYRTEKIVYYDPKIGYNKAEKVYNTYHKKLDSFDNGIFMRFLPRDISGLHIIDLGCGDGRLSKYFVNKNVGRYVGCDISDKLLKRCKSFVEKYEIDLEQKVPFENESFDVALCFFVLLHIDNIRGFFEEVYRILKTGGRFVVLHHLEKRPFEYKIDGESFKIHTNVHRYETIENIAKDCFFDIDYIDLIENGVMIGRLYCFSKN